MRRILIVVSDGKLASLLETGFGTHGFATSTVANARTASELCRSEDFDLVILDTALESLDGVDALREACGEQQLPIVALGAGAEPAGPDPFEALLDRVRTLTDRPAAEAGATLAAGHIELDPWQRQARIGATGVSLTAREFTLLEVFARNPGRVLSREQLHLQVWGYEHDPGSNVVEVYIGYLRKKLGSELIETVRGRGYRLKPRSRT